MHHGFFCTNTARVETASGLKTSDEPVLHLDELFNIGHMQPHRGLIENIQGVRRFIAATRDIAAHLRYSVTSLMRWASPPLSVGAPRSSVR